MQKWITKHFSNIGPIKFKTVFEWFSQGVTNGKSFVFSGFLVLTNYIRLENHDFEFFFSKIFKSGLKKFRKNLEIMIFRSNIVSYRQKTQKNATFATGYLRLQRPDSLTDSLKLLTRVIGRVKSLSSIACATGPSRNGFLEFQKAETENYQKSTENRKKKQNRNNF